jgi:hypothetical protein
MPSIIPISIVVSSLVEGKARQRRSLQLEPLQFKEAALRIEAPTEDVAHPSGTVAGTHRLFMFAA